MAKVRMLVVMFKTDMQLKFNAWEPAYTAKLLIL